MLKVTVDKIKNNQSYDEYIESPENRVLNILFEDCSIEQLKDSSPIIIIGGKKSGKTHLLNALHLFYSGIIDDSDIIHTDCVELVNDLLSDITQGTSEISAYYNAEILLLDNVELLWGKEQCQEKVCTLIRQLKQRGKLVVMTIEQDIGYDDAIAEFKGLLEGGMIIELKPLEDLYLFKLNKKLEKNREQSIDKFKDILNKE